MNDKVRKVSLDDDGNRFRHAQQKIVAVHDKSYLWKIINVSRFGYAKLTVRGFLTYLNHIQ